MLLRLVYHKKRAQKAPKGRCVPIGFGADAFGLGALPQNSRAPGSVAKSAVRDTINSALVQNRE